MRLVCVFWLAQILLHEVVDIQVLPIRGFQRQRILARQIVGNLICASAKLLRAEDRRRSGVPEAVKFCLKLRWAVVYVRQEQLGIVKLELRDSGTGKLAYESGSITVLNSSCVLALNCEYRIS